MKAKNKTIPLSVKQRVDKITELQAIKTPWEVKRFIGELEIFGDNVSFNGDGKYDYLSIQEARKAMEWVIEELGGEVTWDE